MDELRARLASCHADRVERQVLGGELVALLLEAGDSYRAIERHTGVSRGTAGRWLAIYQDRVKGETA